MNVLVTGGAGFIGRWLVAKLLADKHHVWVLDNLLNGHEENLSEFISHKHFKDLIIGDYADAKIYKKFQKVRMDKCFHLAARVVVQDSLDKPMECFQNDVTGVMVLLEYLRKTHTGLVFVSSCMVYDLAKSKTKINENHPVKPASPYSAYKLAAEHIALSYHYAYQLPVTILRPFNTYGPFQKSTGEGGVISIFLRQLLEGVPLTIYGSGRQTRDFLYVQDCAEFISRAGFLKKTNGHILNAGTGVDVSVNCLAKMICTDDKQIVHKVHIHPQSEIMKLVCDQTKSKKMLGWCPQTRLDKGLAETKFWLREQLQKRMIFQKI